MAGAKRKNGKRAECQVQKGELFADLVACLAGSVKHAKGVKPNITDQRIESLSESCMRYFQGFELDPYGDLDPQYAPWNRITETWEEHLAKATRVCEDQAVTRHNEVKSGATSYKATQHDKYADNGSCARGKVCGSCLRSCQHAC